ncbi:LADA_0B08416g1_1 [Lachancea dasiensis]|uniref:LADA_0B08416g1_1 n=1 Tax=Lachancea dasiensis TaxID=1072105 RepID=A0A1G4IUE8_9SACH|nr:LADA_0B08416g1_1 [Lachancea dasiensis]
MSSLKQLQQKSARRKQVYRPILDNPYTDEAHSWPRVQDPAVVAELTRTHVTEVLRHAPDALEAHCGFNAVVAYLQRAAAPPAGAPVFLFVCNRDPVPGVVLAQIPVLARVARCEVVLVPLPRGFIAHLDGCGGGRGAGGHQGLLLVVQNGGFDPHFAEQLRQRVGHATRSPWLEFVAARVGVVPSEVGVGRKASS